MTTPDDTFPHEVDGGPFRVDAYDALPSTNDRARDLAAAGASDVVVIADRQTAGRGRQDREWVSPPGGIWLSLLVRPDLRGDRVPLLTFAAAVAVVEAVGLVGVDAGIKWPNDVLVETDGGERKLGGILTEASMVDGSLEWAVVGVGLNANVDVDALPAGSTSLGGLVGAVDRTAVTESFLTAFDRLRDDPEATLSAWRRDAVTIGRNVRVTTGSGSVEGIATGVDDAGRLLVDTGDGVEPVAAGDCEHLRPA